MNDEHLRVLVRDLLRGDKPPPGCAIRPATVDTRTGSDPGDTHVVVDGDTTPTPALSLLGAVNAGERVMVLFWPPHGAYIFGRPGTPGTQWHDAAFTAGWGNFGGSFQDVQYRKEGDWTYLRGVAARTSGVATTIFTLPVGWRIQVAQEDFPVVSSLASFSVVSVLPSGAVVFTPGAGAPGSAADYVSLSGIRFASSDFT